MKKISILAFTLSAIALSVSAQTKQPMEMKPEMTEIWEPEVPVVTPGRTAADAPSDAIILFDGNDLSKNGQMPKAACPDGK
jgi:hypothetical protein